MIGGAVSHCKNRYLSDSCNWLQQVAEIISLDSKEGLAEARFDSVSIAANCANSPAAECARKTKMRARSQMYWYLGVVVLLCSAPRALGQELQINNPPSTNIMDGIYVGSYGATDLSTGGSVQITCDDFKDNSDFNAASYTTTAFSSLGTSLGSTLWGSSGATLTQYEQAAWLVLGMLKQTGMQQGYYSYAIWAVFDSIDVANWFTSHGDAGACNAVFGTGAWGSGCNSKGGTGGLLAGATGQTYTLGEFSNVLILTPTGCKNGPGSCPEQEFFEVVAEGGSAVMYLLLAGLSCFGAIFFRSRQQVHEKMPV